MGITFFGLLLLLVLAVVIVLPAIAVWLGLRHKPASEADGGRCGKCGYAVRGLESMTCPECGADLREVGITAARSGGGGFLMAASAWLIFTAVLGGILALVTVRAVALRPGSVYHQRHVVMQVGGWAAPLMAERDASGEVAVRFHAAPGSPRLIVDPTGKSCRVESSGSSRPFDGAAVRDWLQPIHAPPSDPAVAQAADEAVVAVDELVHNPMVGATRFTHVTAYAPTMLSRTGVESWVVPLLALVCTLCIGLGGVLWLRGRMRPAGWQVAAALVVWLGGLGCVGTTLLYAVRGV